MRSLCASAALAVAALLATGCGYIGGPLPPLANVPLPVTDLSAVQRAATIVVRFTVPYRTTEQQPIRGAVKLDLRIGPAKEQFQVDEWARSAKPIANPSVEHGIAIYEVPAATWNAQEVVAAVRAIGPNGKESSWSNYAVFRVVAPPEVPSKPEVAPTPQGVKITWKGTGDQFRILRRAGTEENFTVAQTAAGHEWTDTDVESGRPHSYCVVAMVNAGDRKFAESNPSDVAEITWVDKFPPAVPVGLAADAAGNSVSLVWTPDTDADLAGYRIYRSTGGGPWQKMADANTVPNYSDTTVEHGKSYRYAVTAFDRLGNESDRSGPAEVTP